jgi:hypothetical protein
MIEANKKPKPFVYGGGNTQGQIPQAPLPTTKFTLPKLNFK